MEIHDQVRAFLTANFYVPDASALKDDASLLDQGLIDSTGVLELVDFIEERYSFKVEDEEVIPGNLDSIKNVATYVVRKLSCPV